MWRKTDKWNRLKDVSPTLSAVLSDRPRQDLALAMRLYKNEDKPV